jgi:serine/threonine-protein kinase
MPLITRHGDELAVPNVVGRSQAEAEDTLAKKGLTLQITGREFSPDKPEGVILTQVPPAGMMVKSGRGVKAIISAGVRVAEVPDVFGLPMRQADLTIQKAGFVIGDMYWTDVDSLPEEVAVETIPSKGTILPLGSRVSLAINRGTKEMMVFMPGLEGMSLDRARTLLDSLDLPIADLRYVRDTLLLPNTVIEQHPTRNTQIERGDSVRISVSTTD